MASRLPDGVVRCALHDCELEECPDCASPVRAPYTPPRFPRTPYTPKKRQRIALVNDALKQRELVVPASNHAVDALSHARGCMAPDCHWSAPCPPCEEARIFGDAPPSANPLCHIVDGLTVHECLAIYTELQREDNTRKSIRWLGTQCLTPAQKDAARAAWSAELRTKVEAGKQKGVEIVVDDDRWEE